ncbi:MAG: hypothetical protein KDK39_02530 [Leptospiraceae bacterium]|nr:hypothetical protein [Leptospiraceae bacterium]
MKKNSWKDIWRYRFDNFMASGPRSVFLSLLLLFLAAFVLTAILRVIVESALGHSIAVSVILNDLWLSFLQITDPGAMAEDGENTIVMKLVGMLTVFLGLIFFSAVIAFITTQLDERIADLKKGRSRVIEKGHILILGWGEMVVEIVRELIEANASRRDAAVVILAEEPKEEMDAYLNERLPQTGNTRIITRTGQISSIDSLARVSVTDCKSVIVLPEANEAAPEGEKATSDAKALKAILAVVASSKDDASKANIIAEVHDLTKREVMTNLAPDNITMVNTRDIVARIIVQTSRSSGLAVVYATLIGFDGSEIYFHKGNYSSFTFAELAYRFVEGVPIGVRHSDGQCSLKPDNDYAMQADDAVIIIARDDSAIRFSPQNAVVPGGLPLCTKRLQPAIEKELIIGWNAKCPIIIQEYANYILPGSMIHIVLPPGAQARQMEMEALIQANPAIQIEFKAANSLKESDLRRLQVHEYNNVILLNEIEDDTEKLDSETITRLLLIREILADYSRQSGNGVHTQLITEVMNSDNLELVARTGVNDTIISHQMISKIMAQVAENPDILAVYEVLFSDAGSEIYLKPLHLYLESLPEVLSVADLIELAQKRGEVFIGYRRYQEIQDVHANFGVRINLPKNERIRPHAMDTLIVLAEDEL